MASPARAQRFERPFEVWHDHQRLATFSADHGVEVEGNALRIVDWAGQEVAHYAGGDWSAVGTDITCAFLAADPDCPGCASLTPPG